MLIVIPSIALHSSSSSASAAKASRAFESVGRALGDVMLCGGETEVLESWDGRNDAPVVVGGGCDAVVVEGGTEAGYGAACG